MNLASKLLTRCASGSCALHVAEAVSVRVYRPVRSGTGDEEVGCVDDGLQATDPLNKSRHDQRQRLRMELLLGKLMSVARPR